MQARALLRVVTVGSLAAATLAGCFAHPGVKSAEGGDGPLQTETDESSSYELLSAQDHEFAITYEVAATTGGARVYYTLARGGVYVSGVSAEDVYTAEKLSVGLVEGTEARKKGHPAADPDASYFAIFLARPVPENGAERLRIRAQYKDETSYSQDGDRIVFERALAAERVSVVLPRNFEIVACNHPVRVRPIDDGRLQASYVNPAKAPVMLRIEARALHVDGEHAHARGGSELHAPIASSASQADVVQEDRELVCTLEDPSKREFRLTHDFTRDDVASSGGEMRSEFLCHADFVTLVTAVSARLVDTGEPLTAERDEEISGTLEEAHGNPVAAQCNVRLNIPAHGGAQSVRVRIEAACIDATPSHTNYAIDGNEIVWRSTFEAARSALILPKDYALCTTASPARIEETPEGRIRLDFVDARSGPIPVLVRAIARAR